MSIANVQNLCKRYPGFELKDVCFTLERGRIAGFIGRNGAGKTTTLKAMVNLVRPDSGEINCFGLPLNGNERAIKQRIGYASGSLCCYPRRRIRDIISVTKRFYDNWDEAACQRFMALFRLDADKTPLQLSEGMKVKFKLMLALSHGAEFLILDEPTSGLDPFSRDELLEQLELLRDEGVAILFSTHIISDIEKCADDILYISGGRLLTAMPKAEFMQSHVRDGETLEQAFLRLERGNRHA